MKAEDFPFYNAFRQYFIFRNSCYSCKFVGKDRVSDFTLGDFWGYAHLDRIKDFNKGYSQLYINSDKGLSVFNAVKDSCWLEEVPVGSPIAENKCYLYVTPQSIINKFFMYDYSRLPYEKVEKRYMIKFKQFSFFKKVLWHGIRRLGL